MKFTAVIVAALATVASAKPKFTNSNFDVVAGQSFELKWTDAKGPVTIELKTGTPPNGMKSFSTLATGVSGTSTTVTIPKDVPSGQYAFTVADGPGADDTNWSAAFSLTGTGSSSSSSASAASTSSSSSSSATSSSTSSSATTMTTSTTSASAKSNSTTATTSSGSTSTKATTTAATTSAGTTGTIPNSNSSGNKVQSSLALVMLGAVAYAFLN
ncbi:hypothetical protein MAPG_06684 [Magnaporthiopsis poae ATCC 64411]|uniref:Extracellular matrix protein n=1 Tax=Magnaporthiopsis poae (strain ATCC 64411 / 73-15) TaxID=644358 RepID=A0A0C4E2P4_MAGP6|nr:hypothetical protein MAPG_06684 [Magnaporthiopsis poae ATCC 64411]